MQYRDKTVAVIDHGLFIDFAVWLQKHFGRVLYTTPWQCAFPKSNDCMIGSGLIERVESIWDHLDEIDLFIFPDIYHAADQRHLADLDKRVWGSRESENLEIWRIEAKQFMSRSGIPIGPYAVVGGTARLRERLRDSSNKFIKVSKTRGDFETFKHNEWSLTEPWLDELENKLGPKKKFIEFVVEEPIDPALEIGYDGYCIDGKFADPGIVGVEIKDAAYLGKVVDRLPAQLETINQKLAPTFKRLNYRNFFCSEIRIKKDKGYMLDPCCRMPSPPGDLYPLWYSNLPEILWEGSDGNYVPPQYTNKWGAILMLTSEWVKDKWTGVDWPKEYRENVTLRAHAKVNGKDYIVPDYGVGSVSAVGASAQEVIDKVLEIAKEVKGLGITYKGDALDEALEEFGKIEFPKVEPKPEPVKAPDKDSLAALLEPQAKARSLDSELSEALG